MWVKWPEQWLDCSLLFGFQVKIPKKIPPVNYTGRGGCLSLTFFLLAAPSLQSRSTVCIGGGAAVNKNSYIDPRVPGLGLSLPIYRGSAEVGLREGWNAWGQSQPTSSINAQVSLKEFGFFSPSSSPLSNSSMWNGCRCVEWIHPGFRNTGLCVYPPT